MSRRLAAMFVLVFSFALVSYSGLATGQDKGRSTSKSTGKSTKKNTAKSEKRADKAPE